MVKGGKAENTPLSPLPTLFFTLPKEEKKLHFRLLLLFFFFCFLAF